MVGFRSSFDTHCSESNGDAFKQRMRAFMQHLPTTEVERRLVREIACVSCYQRPPGSETLGPQVARSCEGTCPLFLHLPKLARLASQVGDRSGECDAAVKDQICQGCILKESAGDFCPDYSART